LSLVVSETLRGNRLNGILIAIVPLLTDLPIVLISIYMLNSLSQIDIALGLLSLAGSGLLVYLGLKNFQYQAPAPNSTIKYRTSIKYGIATNFLSPHPYLFWITIGAPTFIKASKSSPTEGFVFILAFYLLLIGSKIMIAVISDRFGKMLTGSKYAMIIKGLGILLIVLAGVMLYDGIKLVLKASSWIS
jgi:threonine/homoserine/homoserine lactone efflux protein